MHKSETVCVGPIHGCTAYWVRDEELPSFMRDGIRHRYQRLALKLEDGGVWVLDRVAVPVGSLGLSFKAAAWSLKLDRDRMGRGIKTCWKPMLATMQKLSKSSSPRPNA